MKHGIVHGEQRNRARGERERERERDRQSSGGGARPLCTSASLPSGCRLPTSDRLARAPRASRLSGQAGGPRPPRRRPARWRWHSAAAYARHWQEGRRQRGQRRERQRSGTEGSRGEDCGSEGGCERLCGRGSMVELMAVARGVCAPGARTLLWSRMAFRRPSRSTSISFRTPLESGPSKNSLMRIISWLCSQRSGGGAWARRSVSGQKGGRA